MVRRIPEKISKNKYLPLILTVGFCLMCYGIWVRSPNVMGPDEKRAVTSALWLGVNRTPFIPDFLKGGNLYLYFLVVPFVPVFLSKLLTGQVSTLARQSREAPTFWDAPPELRQAFYDFLLAGRFASVLVGTITLYLVYLLGRDWYSRRVGLLASAYLAVGMGFVNTAHLATEDTLLTMLLVLTFLLLSRYSRLRDERYLYAGAVSAGATVATKLTAGFLIFPLVYFALNGSSWPASRSELSSLADPLRRVFKTGSVSLLTYLLFTPGILVYPSLYLKTLFAESSAALSSTAAYPGWVLQTFAMGRSLGLPLFCLAMVGMVYVVYDSVINEPRQAIVALFLFIVPYYAVIGYWQTLEIWYAVPIMPYFTIFAAQAIDRGYERHADRLVTALVIFTLLFSLVYTGIAVAQMSNDARVGSTAYLEENVPAGSTTDTYQYELHLPRFPNDTQVNKYHFNDTSDDVFETAQRRISCGIPDYLVLSSVHYGDYTNSDEPKSEEVVFYERLFNGSAGYETVATYGPGSTNPDTLSNMFRLTVTPETPTNRNLRIVIMKRTKLVDQSCLNRSRALSLGEHRTSAPFQRTPSSQPTTEYQPAIFARSLR
jgi:hypothetical protein